MTFPWNWLLGLPPGIGSAIVGGLFTCVAAVLAFLGIAWSLRGHRHRERLGREHDMRQGVYFQYAEAHSRVLEYLGQMANHNLPEADLRALIKDYGPICAKLHLVGGLASIKCLNQINLKWQSAAFDLSIQRAQLLNLKLAHETVLRNLTEVMDRVKSLRPIGTNDNATAVQAMGPTWENLQARQSELDSQVKALSLSMFRQSTKCIHEIVPLQIDAVLVAREVLGLKIDGEAYKAETEKALDEQKKIMDAFYDRLDGRPQTAAAPQAATAQEPKK